MKFWAGVTDNKWFEFLSQRLPEEVNFWQPRGEATYTQLGLGSLFLFKLKRPYNHIAGGGYFVRSSSLPLSMAWEAFGTKNGADSRRSFQEMITRLTTDASQADPMVGCTVLTQPFFWPRSDWIEAPAGWGNSIVRGRYYDDQAADGAALWSEVSERLVARNLASEKTARLGEPVLVRPRLGQGAFRVVVTDVYMRRCAITGESTLPVLEAAHILPFAENGPNEASNGLLLRSDFHKLFDLGLVTVTPSHHIEVSSRIRDQWFNGKAYYRLHGQKLASIPTRTEDQPSAARLQWHNENRFRA